MTITLSQHLPTSDFKISGSENTDLYQSNTPSVQQRIKPVKEGFKLTNTIAAICVATHALITTTGEKWLQYGALNIPRIFENGEVWRVVTHPFIHSNAVHLVMNLSALLKVGPAFEKRWGKLGIVQVAALSIAVDILAKVALGTAGISVGFSGVLCGMVGALHVHRLSNNQIKFDKNGFFNFLTGNILTSILLESSGFMRIDHLAHISGYVAGVAFAILSNKT